MPEYIIYRKKGKKSVVIGYVPSTKNIRTAWGFFKKNHKRKLIKGWEYHLYAMNHARFWYFEKGKWKIGSWYQNHLRKPK